MSLWGCDCPLPVLTACHQRGKVCSRLSLFSPLFCARAWRCLRLGLAFRVVDSPQSGLLAQIISLSTQTGRGLDTRMSSQGSWRLMTPLRAASSGPSPLALQLRPSSSPGAGRAEGTPETGRALAWAPAGHTATPCTEVVGHQSMAATTHESPGRAERCFPGRPAATQGGQDVTPQAATSGQAGPSGWGFAARLHARTHLPHETTHSVVV